MFYLFLFHLCVVFDNLCVSVGNTVKIHGEQVNTVKTHVNSQCKKNTAIYSVNNTVKNYYGVSRWPSRICQAFPVCVLFFA